MSQPSQFIVLHEDKMQLVFVQRFLKNFGVHHRLIRSVLCPKGKGSGEQHVRNNYADNLKAYRRRTATTVLIVVIDADKGTVKGHHLELDQAAKDNNVAPRAPHDNVVHIIPKRHVESWLAYLAGENISEDVKYKDQNGFRKKESDCHVLIDRLFDACKHHHPLTNTPPSLEDACQEFARIRHLL